MKQFRFSLLLSLCLTINFHVVVDVYSQGAAAPRRPAQPVPKVKSDVPIPKVLFQDVAAEDGLTARHVTGEETEKKYIIETSSSGVALRDYDNDGWLDRFLVNGDTLSRSPSGVNDKTAPTNHLYRNNRNGTFTDVTEKANLVRTGWGQGVCAGDYNNDGNIDLFVTYWGQNVLYQNNGKGAFTDVTEKAGLIHKAARWSTGCSFLDYDKDGHLDLFVANYVDLDLKKTPA